MMDEVVFDNCPFCGGKTMRVRGIAKAKMVYCMTCGATVSFQGRESIDDEKLAELYNRRAGK